LHYKNKLTELQAQITEDTSTRTRIMIIMIAAASENNALGKNNELVWFTTISKGSKSHFRTSYHYGAKNIRKFSKTTT
jgi:hypothetical protein